MGEVNCGLFSRFDLDICSQCKEEFYVTVRSFRLMCFFHYVYFSVTGLDPGRIVVYWRGLLSATVPITIGTGTIIEYIRALTTCFTQSS